MGEIRIETSSDVYFRERNEDKKVFKNIEIWAIIPVPVDGAEGGYWKGSIGSLEWIFFS